MSYPPDTIAAPATPPGRGGVAIVRVSGPLVVNITKKILNKTLQPRLATFTAFIDANGQILDQGIAIYFPAPHSFTGEDVLELHCHGGTALVDCLMQSVLAQGARIAKPGEFSERAFLNDKIDLAQAEAIADLINAQSAQAVRASVRSLQGEFSAKVHELVELIIYIRMYIESAIDFSEEEIDFLQDTIIVEKLNTAIQQLEDLRASATQGCLLREGITVVIAGAPNVGKSSLLNRLSGNDSAIVTDIPGTTRDLLRVEIQIDGLPLHIIDTAGLRESDDPVEQEGIRRAREQIKQADMILLVVAANQSQSNHWDLAPNAIKILVRNKIDLTQESPHTYQEESKTIICLSAKENQGIDLLRNHIKKCAGYQTAAEGIFSARRRHLEALEQTKIFLADALKQLSDNRAGELAAEELRQAQHALGEITGVFTSDDLLGRIFSSFCIGK